MAHKYRKGNHIYSIYSLLKKLKSGQIVYYKKLPTHPKFLLNLSVRRLEEDLEDGRFREAIEKESLESEGHCHLGPPRWRIEWQDGKQISVCTVRGCTVTKHIEEQKIK